MTNCSIINVWKINQSILNYSWHPYNTPVEAPELPACPHHHASTGRIQNLGRGQLREWSRLCETTPMAIHSDRSTQQWTTRDPERMYQPTTSTCAWPRSNRIRTTARIQKGMESKSDSVHPHHWHLCSLTNKDRGNKQLGCYQGTETKARGGKICWGRKW